MTLSNFIARSLPVLLEEKPGPLGGEGQGDKSEDEFSATAW